MTHDELLVEITNAIEDNDYDYSCAVISHTPMLQSLRAVVELHKPFDDKKHGHNYCKACQINGLGYRPYPCPTIQAITEQLK